MDTNPKNLKSTFTAILSSSRWANVSIAAFAISAILTVLLWLLKFRAELVLGSHYGSFAIIGYYIYTIAGISIISGLGSFIGIVGLMSQKKKRSLLGILSNLLIIFLAFGILGQEEPNDGANYIEPNSFEWSYYGIAIDIDSADLCYKISPKAVTTAAWGSEGHKITSTRSDCFYTVAVQTHNPDLCQNVKPIKTKFLDGSKLSPTNCEAEASGKGDNSRVGASDDYELILRLLGYINEDLTRMRRKDKTFFDLYMEEKRKPEFRAKLANLPDFSVSDEEAKKQIYALAPECVNDKSDSNPLCFRINCGVVRGLSDPKCNIRN